MFSLKIVDLANIKGDYYQRGNFNDLVPGKDYDCIITPGNSFGIMDGGFDKVVADKFPDVQDIVQGTIRRQGGNELQVGRAVIVPLTDNSMLCYAPTMRFPSPIKMKDLAYTVAYAAFLEIFLFNKMFPDREIKQVVMPLFCTATGGMPANVSYDQIVYAYEQLSGGPSTSGNDWGNLVAHRANLKYLSSWANLRTGK